MFAQWLVRCGLLLPFVSPVVNLPPQAALGPCGECGSVVATCGGESEPPGAAVPCPIADEITQLHRALQMSPLAGSALEQAPISTRSDHGRPGASATAEFEQVLRSLLQTPIAEACTVPLEGSAPAGAADSSLPLFLRTISRQLDQLANDLEDRREYATADELRGLSQQLRQRSRRID